MANKNYIKIFKLIFTILGIVIFSFLILKIGVEKIMADISLVGLKLLYLLPLAISWHLLNSVAWYLLVRESGLKTTFFKVFINKWAAESLNSALPLGNLGGEAFRVVMLSSKLKKEASISNVVHDRLMHYVASFIFICAGSIYGIIFLDQLSIRTKTYLLLTIAGLIFGFFILKLLLKKGLLKIKSAKFQKYLDSISDDLFHSDRKTKIWVLVLNIAARILGTIEIYMVLCFLKTTLSFSTCLLYSSFLVLLNLLFFIVPGGIGVLEGGQVAFISWLGMTPSIGLSLAVIRRIRQLTMTAIGLLFVPFVPEMKEKNT
jgi:uncharacterized membrane protein YbhN (UPF0104 family)